jgi:predicted helicase
MSDARTALREQGMQTDLIRPIAYRPFDTQYYYDHDALVFRRRDKVMRQMKNNNIALAVCRLTRGGDWRHCLVASDPAEDSYVSDKSKERAYLFPLWRTEISEPDDGENQEGNLERRPSHVENLSPDFRGFIDSRYEHHYTPEEILGYIYAVLHAPTYRARYAEFLRIDFPRVPFPESADDFEALSGLGWALIQAHLLRELPRRGLADYHGRGDHTVEVVRYAPAEQAIAINKTQSFKPVPQDVWESRIGGYQVLDKYLKSRRGRVLSLDEIGHVGAVADSLACTIDQMARIDEAYRLAFQELT